MLIGNKHIFAFEIKECDPISPILKDVHFWIGGNRIGNEYPYFATYLDQAKRFFETANSNILFHDSFHGMSDQNIYAFLNNILDNDQEIEGLDSDFVYHTFFIANWDDALDGWNIFLVEKNNNFILLWEKDQLFNSFEVPKKIFIDVFRSFIKHSEGLTN